MFGFTLDDLVNIYRAEKTSQDLVELPDNFYLSVAKLTSRLVLELKHGDPLRRDLLREELRNVIYMVQDIHLARVFKAVDKVIRGDIPAPMLDRERYAFSEVRQILEKLRNELLTPAITGKVSVTAPIERTKTLLIILIDLPEKIIGADMRNYGPFIKGNIVNIPQLSAEMMVKHGMAREIKARV